MLIDVLVIRYSYCFDSYYLLYCVPEILVLGCGKRIGRVSKELRDFLHSNGIKIEAIDTVHDFKALLFFLFDVSTTLCICIEHFFCLPYQPYVL